MKRFLLFFSHKLTQEQEEYAVRHYDKCQFIYLPISLQELLSNVPAELENLNEYLKPIKNFIIQNATHGDIVLIQGEFGMVYSMVSFCKDYGLTTIYATTERKVEEFVEDGKNIKKSIFEFKRFREYSN